MLDAERTELLSSWKQFAFITRSNSVVSESRKSSHVVVLLNKHSSSADDRLANWAAVPPYRASLQRTADAKPSSVQHANRYKLIGYVVNTVLQLAAVNTVNKFSYEAVYRTSYGGFNVI